MRNNFDIADAFSERNAFRRLRNEKTQLASRSSNPNNSKSNYLKSEMAKYIKEKSNFFEEELLEQEQE